MDVPTWIWFVVSYFFIGVLIGELYLYGIKRAGHEPSKLAYYVGVCFWWLAVIIGIFGCKRKYEEKDDG